MMGIQIFKGYVYLLEDAFYFQLMVDAVSAIQPMDII